LAAVLGVGALAQCATRLSSVALPWFVLTGTGSVRMTGLVTFAELTPYVLVKLLAGPLVDRLGGRRISVLGDCVSAAAALSVPLARAAGALPWWLLLVLVAVLGGARGPADTAKDVLVPAAARGAGMSLPRAAGLVGTANRLATVLGPALAGAMAGLWGAANALLGTAVLFAAGAVVVPLAVPRTAVDADGALDGGPGAVDTGRYRERLRAGFRHLRSDRLVRSLVVMVCCTNLLDSAFSSVLLPAWVREHGRSAAELGLLVATAGAAATLGSVLMALAGDRLPRRAALVVGFALCGPLRFAVLAAGAPLGVVLAVFAVGGTGAGVLNPLFGALLYERIPAPLYGRVLALIDSGAWTGVPLGGLIGGFAVGWTGLTSALTASAGTYLGLSLVPLTGRQFLELKRRDVVRG
jgi:MFS family permease